MDRIVTPLGVLPMVRPCAGLNDLIEDQEREDNARGPEPEPESVLRAVIRRPVIGGTSWR
ncbi:hypothetical protein OG352_39800 (plasmid) [Streptomyces sp. NBC_01485]|uniref:hypothetical protein n=1 Tax=Streptomyces sp. NBC_01485 TaxID=2903884 RepID=UPI002E371B5F|nr:hypothetical protein [Streptomyces sp. NBC_01485]